MNLCVSCKLNFVQNNIALKIKNPQVLLSGDLTDRCKQMNVGYGSNNKGVVSLKLK